MTYVVVPLIASVTANHSTLISLPICYSLIVSLLPVLDASYFGGNTFISFELS